MLRVVKAPRLVEASEHKKDRIFSRVEVLNILFQPSARDMNMEEE